MSLLLALTAGSGPTYTLAADSGSYTLAGQATGLAFNRVLQADTTSYSLNGQAVSLAFNRVLSAASAAYTLTGQATGLAFNRVLVADSSGYALTGQSTGLAFNRVLSAANGSYSLTGQNAGLAFNRALIADSASYTLTGQAVTLTYTPLSGPTYTLIADSAAYALTGQAVGLARGWVLSAASGAYALSGQAVTLTYGTAYDIKVYQCSLNTAAGSGAGRARKPILIDVRGKIHEFATEQGANAFLKSLEPIEEKQIQAKARRIVSAVTRTGNAFQPTELTPVKVISGPPELTALANMRAAILQGQLNALVNAQIQAEMQQLEDDELAAVAVMMMME